MRSEIEKAIRIAGSEAALAHLTRVAPRTVENWKKAGKVNPTAARLLELEMARKVRESKLVEDDDPVRDAV